MRVCFRSVLVWTQCADESRNHLVRKTADTTTRPQTGCVIVWPIWNAPTTYEYSCVTRVGMRNRGFRAVTRAQTVNT